MEIKVNALMLRAVDYNENDKILTLLTAERGKITAGIKGVKKAAAKLKFAAQPFCFAEYILSVRGERYTVINCSECESFYDLRTDINKFYAAAAVTEGADAMTFPEADCEEIFYECVKTLSEICTGGESFALIRFLLFALKISGYGINTGKCAVCGKELNSPKIKFDMESGSFLCEECGGGTYASLTTYNVMRRAQGESYNSEHISADGEKRALRLLREYMSYKLGLPSKSLSEYLRLL